MATCMAKAATTTDSRSYAQIASEASGQVGCGLPASHANLHGRLCRLWALASEDEFVNRSTS